LYKLQLTQQKFYAEFEIRVKSTTQFNFFLF